MKLHELDCLNDLLGRKLKDQGTGVSSHDSCYEAKSDVYNYAARFGCVPKWQLTKFNESLKTMVEVTIELPEQGIRVTARGPNIEQAEISAASRFKEAAEKFHTERGQRPFVIKESTALTTSNSRKFFDYYKVVRPRERYIMNTALADERRGMGELPTKAQVIIDGEPIGECVEYLGKKKKAEDLAFLTAAVALCKKDPGLKDDFFQALQSGNGNILRPVPPNQMSVDEDCVLIMRDTLVSARRAGLPDEADDMISDEPVTNAGPGYFRRHLTPEKAEIRNRMMQESLNAYIQDERLKEVRRKKSELPMNHYATKVLDMVSNNAYSIIVGATGSGKTTQVPQILLENAISNGRGSECNIICTQPRRIAATSVAQRVSDERGERLQETVGYQVRFDAKLPKTRGSITYCTTGILLAQLQRSPDAVMNDTSHIIIDEVHERDTPIDFLLALLKRIMLERDTSGRKTPKVILMSATIDTDLFASYFKYNVPGGNMKECPTLHVPGRTFPVAERFLDEILDDMNSSKLSSALNLIKYDGPTKEYLEANARFCREQYTRKDVPIANTAEDDAFVIDWKKEHQISRDGEVIDIQNEKEESLVPHGLVAATIAHIALTSTEGAILVFLPGLEDILRVNTLLLETPIPGAYFNNTSKFKLLLLHSSIPGGQTEVFDPVAKGCRKIILATNIAETSITIPDVQYVVDTGKKREKQYDQMRRITQLQCVWISKANSKQRAGRAGRVQNGHYYALFPRARYNALRSVGLPEILRSDLQEICLDVKAQAFEIPIRDFLAGTIEPPPPKAVDASVWNLQALDALSKDEGLTPLGRLLALLPVHPTLGKMIVLGVLFRCLDPMLILGAGAAERDIFVSPPGVRLQAHSAKLSFTQGTASDHIALLNAVRELRQRCSVSGEHIARHFAANHYISFNMFKIIENTARQITEILVKSKLIPPSRESQYSEHGPASLNENSSKTSLIKALALAGMHPNVAIATSGRLLRTLGENAVIMHPSSVNAPRDRQIEMKVGTIFTYNTMSISTDGKTLFLRDTTQCTPLIAILFGGGVVQKGTTIEVNGWLSFYINSAGSRTLKTVVEFRKGLDRLLADAFRDLRSGTNEGIEKRNFLADEQARRIFAEGLVEVLIRDIAPKSPAQSRRPERQAHLDFNDSGRAASRAGRLDDIDNLSRDPNKSPMENISALLINNSSRFASVEKWAAR